MGDGIGSVWGKEELETLYSEGIIKKRNITQFFYITHIFLFYVSLDKISFLNRIPSVLYNCAKMVQSSKKSMMIIVHDSANHFSVISIRVLVH